MIGRSNIIFFDEEMDRLVLNIVKDTLFHDIDINIETLVKRIPKILNMIRDKNMAITQLPWILPTKKKFQYRYDIKFARASANRVILERLYRHRDYDNLLGTLLHSYSITNEDSSKFVLVRNHVMFYNMVGCFNSAAALSWILVLLSQNPNTLQKISEEVASVCYNLLRKLCGF
ncbi:cytochrome P450 [Candidatus Coxiella mudrowiae]|uniref:cytochrome P450 n=1 Tax=Candidatus Coxiella mudrowiae TaxID=2054173 RepID=UPI000662AB4C|nr:cytochrome P450 [Candidatus Coxiella mudrowiae]